MRSLTLGMRLGAALGCALSLLGCSAKLTTGDGTLGSDSGGIDAGGPGGDQETLLPFEPHAGLLRRLTRTQFQSAMRDLTGAEIDVSELDPDSYSGDFASVGASTVTTSALGVERYHAVVESAVNEVMADDGRREAFLGCTPAAGDDPCVVAFIERVGRRAFRRPLTPEEVERLTAVAVTAATELESPLEGARWASVALLTSPHFLYRPELGTQGADGSGRLTGEELATRLAFLVWNGLPDDQLLDDAASGALETEAGVLAALDRMLAAPLGREAASAFAADYMRLDRVVTQPKDAGLFPEYGPELQRAMVEDMRQTWANIAFDPEASFLDVFSTQEVVANRELAELYGLDASGLDSQTFERFTLPAGSPRAGVLSKPGFLSQFANQKEGSPTLRGKFIREAIMCSRVPPPPPNVALEIPESSSDAPSTKRERLEQHRSDPACAGCHELMDPLGLPFENFDAIGRFRTREGELTIDPSGAFDGRPVQNAGELGVVMSESHTVADCLVRKYYSYAVGHEVRDVDESVVQAALGAFEVGGFKFDTLVREIVMSAAFSSVAPQP